MARILLLALIVLPQTNSIKKCPIECTCDMDVSGRYSAICERGNTFNELVESFRILFIDFHIKRQFHFSFCRRLRPIKTGNMKHIPVKELDDEINVIVIRKPKNTLTLGAVFQTFKKLEILRIIESNVPAIGMHSFWGVPSLRVLGKLTQIYCR